MTSATTRVAPIRPANPGDASYPHMLPIELALGLNPVSEICEAYGLDRAAFAAICEIPQFQAEFDWAMDEKMKPGGSVRLQCAMMSGEAVKVLYLAMTDVDNNINQRASHAKDILRYAWIEPPRQKEGADTADRFNIVINMTHGQPVQVNTIEHE